MNSVRPSLCFFFTLTILICLYGYYFIQLNTGLGQEQLATSIDTVISHVTLSQFDAQGSLANQLSTPRIQHIQKENVYWFASPHILVSKGRQAPWSISSEKAKSVQGSKHITLIGKVVAHQNTGNNTKKQIFKTEEITYYPQEKKAVSHRLVTYKQAGTIIQAIGMNAYLQEKRVELLHQAKGLYVPEDA